MTKRLFLFAAWCLIAFSGSVAASYYAWSPFSDEDRDDGPTVRGPSHK